ncbi:MAG TPA: DUF3300 domain-containing protein [Phycisphaerales bacterium]|nr:DUF3300 domain-containing protein [Phycisphaerales bacterium]
MIRSRLVRGAMSFTVCAVAWCSHSLAMQDSASGQAAAQSGDTAAPLKPEELDQLLAPVALYPDSLVSQILMASTYPLEVVEADRWAKANASLKGDALAKELEKQTWDPSVRSLVNFPQVLTMMSEKLDWTVKLGDAFIADQKAVLDSVQRLRGSAKKEGHLESNEQQNVTVEQQGSTQVIQIESTSPDVIYVPQYDPVVVYGGSYFPPAYPPYYYYPPGYVAGTALLSFGIGVACGAAWGYAWGNCNWGHGDVNMNFNQNNNFNRNIDRNKFKNDFDRRGGDRGRGGGDGRFKHDPSHRKGAPYRDRKTASQFGGGHDQAASLARESYRGRAESGRQEINRGGADQFKGRDGGAGNRAGDRSAQGGNRAGNMDRGGGQNRGSAGSTNRGGSGQNRSSSMQNRGSSSGTRSNAFSGAGGGGSGARAASSRGSSSRGFSSGGGGSRGGGAARGGGGRGGGGGRRR